MADHETHAVILIGHGSLRSASGASMIRIAARLRERGIAPLVEAAFLNYSRPTLAEVVAKVAIAGATAVTIQPYFLIAGFYVQNDLRALVNAVSAQFPTLTFQLAPVLGDHPALTSLAQRRVQAARDDIQGKRERHSDQIWWRKPQHSDESPSANAGRGDSSFLPGQAQTPRNDNDAPALLLMAHGTPLPAANTPLYPIAETLVHNLGLGASRVGYLDCNTPTIPAAINDLVAGGAQSIIAFPYFLHLGRHVAEDLPQLIADAQAKHPDVAIHLAHHLDYDLCLVDAVAGLLPAAQPLAQPAALPL